MTSLHVICGLAPSYPQVFKNPGYAYNHDLNTMQRLIFKIHAVHVNTLTLK